MTLVERSAAVLLFFILGLRSVLLSVYRPLYNWDMIGYIAAAKSFEENDIKSIHSFTYNQVQNAVSTDIYKQLVDGYYRFTISTDPSALSEQLPFYQIRPVYTGAIYLLYKSGLNIVFATHFVSGVAIGAASVFLYLMSVRCLANQLVYAVPLLAITFGIWDLATYSTPDGLAYLAIVASTYLYITKRTSALQLMLPIMIGIRTDLILFVIPLLGFLFISEASTRWKTALSAVVSITIYVCIGIYWKNPGWSTIFYFTLVNFLTHPISEPPVLTAKHYLGALLNGVKSLFYNRTFVLYALVATYSLYIVKTQVKRPPPFSMFISTPAALAVVSVSFVASHFLAFPVAWDRFFSGPYLIGAFSLLMMISNYLTAPYPLQRRVASESDSVALSPIAAAR